MNTVSETMASTEAEDMDIESTKESNESNSKSESENESGSANKRKRSYSEMRSDEKNEKKTKKLSDPRTAKMKQEPFKNADWSNTDFLIVRLTYFNKRICRKFPLVIADYAQFSDFIEFYFPSLIGQNWHCENDENWIESKEDLDAVRDYHIATKPISYFLELMIVNEALSSDRIYASKAVHFESAPQTNQSSGHLIYAQPAPTAPIERVQSAQNGYHLVSYPHYLKSQSPKKKNFESMAQRKSIGYADAICPDPTTYLPFAHAGQSTPQMRTLHKIVWVLQHQKKALAVDAIRSCLPGKKKAQIKEIDYLLSSYESYKYTKSQMVNGRKVWALCPDAFPAEFWNINWQRTH